MTEPTTAAEIAALRDEHEALRLAGGYRNLQQRRLMEELVELLNALEIQAQATHNLALVRERLRWKREAATSNPQGSLQRYLVALRVNPDLSLCPSTDTFTTQVVWADEPYDAMSAAVIIAKQQRGQLLRRVIGVEESPVPTDETSPCP